MTWTRSVQFLDLRNLGAEEGFVSEEPVEGDGGLVGAALDEILFGHEEEDDHQGVVGGDDICAHGAGGDGEHIPNLPDGPGGLADELSHCL